MSIWILVWIFISVALLGFLAWSLFISFQQKKVWKAFAEKHKLRYKSNSLMETPELGGVFDDYKIACFENEHGGVDQRGGSRKMIAVEVSLESSLPIDGGIAGGGMVELIKELAFGAEIVPEHKHWDKSYIAAGSNRYVLKSYLTDERLDALIKLMRIKNAWTILIFRGDRMLIRIDTPNPLAEGEYFEKLMHLMVDTAKVMEVDAKEYKALKAEEARGVVKESSLTLDDADAEVSGLSLVEDEPEEAAEESEAEDAVEEAVEEKPKKEASKKKAQAKKPSTKKS